MSCNDPCSTPCAETYREPTLAELNATDPKTPHQHVRAIVVSCPNGKVEDAKMVFEDGGEITNILRAVIAMEAPNKGKGGTCLIYLTRFNNEIGKVVYEVADCFVGAVAGVDVMV